MKTLRDVDRAHHLHPYTDHATLGEDGTHVITGGEGVWVTDDRGRKLLDGLSGLWCVNVGYGCERIADAVECGDASAALLAAKERSDVIGAAITKVLTSAPQRALPPANTQSQKG